VTETTTHENALELKGEGQRLGDVRVANEVVAWIAALAALEVEGVAALYRPGAQPIDRVLRRPVAHRGVRVEVLGEGDDRVLKLDVWIVVEAGGSVPAIGSEVQKRVADAIDRMLGMRLAEVNIFISEVVFA
jgi:uncharacterized alkaline shock family protein YloU